jgi:hypothetical protein
MRMYTIIVFAALALCAGPATAQVPPLMNYQGVLTDGGGAAVPDGTYDITFRLYPDETTESAIWEESKPVSMIKGIFNVILGETVPLEMPFESMLWLGISVEGEEELIPRTPLVATAYSFNARSVQDSAVTTMKIANGSVTTEKLGGGAVTGENIAGGTVVRILNGITDEVNLVEGANITITPSDNNLIIAASGGGGGVTGTGAAGQVAVWNGPSSIDGDNMLYWDDTNKRLGIGTTGPNARLRVESDEQFTAVFASLYASDTTEVLRANYLGGGTHDAVAVKGISRPADGCGIGGDFTGGFKGLIATGNGGNTSRYIRGVEASATGNTTYESFRYGVHGYANGPSGGNNIGVMGVGQGEGAAVIGTVGHGNSDNKIVYGIYGLAEGFGTGTWYSTYGLTYNAGDSCYAGYFTGNLVYTGSLYKISDQMFKKNLRPIEGALNKILTLEPKKFTYTDEHATASVALPRGEHYGLIAQEVEEVLPELVGDLIHPGRPALDADDPIEEPFAYKGINYVELIPILVQAIKEQQQTIAAIQRTISAHEQTIKELKATVEALERR